MIGWNGVLKLFFFVDLNSNHQYFTWLKLFLIKQTGEVQQSDLMQVDCLVFSVQIESEVILGVMAHLSN